MDLFYKEWYHVTHSFAERITGDPHLAADVAQDVFLRLLENPRTLDGVACIKKFLYTCVRNRCINIQLQNTVKKKYLNSRMADGSINNIDQYIAEKEITKNVSRIINAAPPRKKQVLRLRLEGYNDREMSVILGLKRETVKRAIYDSKLDCIKQIGFLR